VSDFIFEKYSIQSGLSMTENECIYEDKLGYIWIGSQMGVDRFDGYGFKNYSNDILINAVKFNPHSITSIKTTIEKFLDSKKKQKTKLKKINFINHKTFVLGAIN
jgi:ligand-binding sensor domain-containing protein